jgi:uncharacterized protein YbjT (DUF2867 family)
MINKSELVLVAGATGRQGGAVTRLLVQKGYRVRALTRHPEKAGDLRKLGAEVVNGDMTDRDSLRDAFHSVRRLFLVTTPYEISIEAEINQGMTMVDAARDAGILHLVFNSVASAHLHTGIPHFESKWEIEKHIRQVGLPSTIIRPVSFMENFAYPQTIHALENGKLRTPVKTDRKVQWIAVDDIAKFVQSSFEQSEKFLGREIDIAGDELTYPECLKVISDLTGKPIACEEISYEEAENTMGHDRMVMNRWINEVGYSADILSMERQWGVKALRFKDWAKRAAFIKALTPKAKAA